MVVPDKFLEVYSIFKHEHVLVMVGYDSRHMTDYVRQFCVNVGRCLMLLLDSTYDNTMIYLEMRGHTLVAYSLVLGWDC